MNLITKISKERFDILAIGTRKSPQALISEEILWLKNQNETLLGTVLYDKSDDDFVWIMLARDEDGRFRCADLGHSYPSALRAEIELRLKMANMSRSSDFKGVIPQGDSEFDPIDLLSPIKGIKEEDFHPYFLELTKVEGRLPARKVISEIGKWLYPSDEHFVREFQCHQFDQRLWEIYLWAAFRELKMDVAMHEAPDFECLAPGINFCVEATTASPSKSGVLLDHPNPKEEEQIKEFLDNYMPMKFGSALTSKLNKQDAQKNHYWDKEVSKDKPFILAVADFHRQADHTQQELGSMVYSQGALYVYLYGKRVDWELNDGELTITYAPIEKHVFKDKAIPSGFFDLPNAENISAVLFSNAGTIAKFDRMGVVAGFTDENHKYFRTGFKFNPDPNAVVGDYFHVDVQSPNYKENWCDELQMFHNPNAKFPLPPEWFPGIAHHFFRDGAMWTIDSKDRVLSSMTTILSLKKDK